MLGRFFLIIILKPFVHNTVIYVRLCSLSGCRPNDREWVRDVLISPCAIYMNECSIYDVGLVNVSISFVSRLASVFLKS